MGSINVRLDPTRNSKYNKFGGRTQLLIDFKLPPDSRVELIEYVQDLRGQIDLTKDVILRVTHEAIAPDVTDTPIPADADIAG